MNKAITSIATVLLITASLLPASVGYAAPAKTAHAAKHAVVVYLCTKCHMKLSAAQAKKDHYVDPMDGGKLIPVKPAAGKKSPSPKPMAGMKM